jgi:hypothetical protein
VRGKERMNLESLDLGVAMFGARVQHGVGSGGNRVCLVDRSPTPRGADQHSP